MEQSEFSQLTPGAQPGETGVYRRADIEAFSQWARATIDGLQRELAGARQQAADAERRAAGAARTLADRDELEQLLERAADRAGAAAAEAAASAAVKRIEALLDDVRTRATAQGRREQAPEPSTVGRDAASSFDDPIRDPLPPWDDRLLAFPDEQSELPPIGPIFERDEHRSA